MSFPCLTGRCARLLCAAGLLFAAGSTAAEPELSLADAARLAVSAQPLLHAQQQRAAAARASAVAAGQLPDPELIAGIADVPVEGDARYSLRRDRDTEFQLGIRQRFPGGAERRLRAELGSLEAQRAEAELEEQRRMIEREAGMAWLDVWRAAQAQQLVALSLVEAQRAQELAQIAYRSGRAAQDGVLAAQVERELLQDRRASLEQEEWHARNQLRRWIGAAAERPLAAALPDWPLPDDDHLLAQLATHPHLRAQQQAVAAAQTGIALAREDYKPDWSLQAAYGHKREYDDMAGIELEIGLPWFTRDRQDRVVEARSAELAGAEAQRDDWLRQHQAEIRLNVDDLRRLQQRFARYDDSILPAAQRRLDAALAAYAAGPGLLQAVVDARRSLLDLQLMRLDLALDAARHQVQLHYFAHDTTRAAEAAP